jgi:phosphopantothenoylcysteine decarboxylase/phosphopantothenate--cysteine ligase
MEVLLGVSGGIAAYKSLDLLRILQRRGHGVSVVMTAAAARFVGPGTFAALSGRRVGLSTFEPAGQPGYPHLDLARAADVMVVAPASANTIARMAAGMADDLLAACYVAFDGPTLVAPAMNTRMLLHPATAENIARLRAHGVAIVEPGSGLLADGETGAGRLASPEEIADAVEAALAGSGPLRGRRVLVSAGGTREPLDPVRFIGNRSSGRMGFAVAEAAHRRGAAVTVLAANVDLPRRAGIRYVDAPTAAALHEAALAEFGGCDLLVMAAAVADYRPAAAAAGKIKRAGVDELEVRLERTADILADLVARRQRQVLVGFAAETGAGGLEEARSKRARKGVDLLVYNDVSAPGVGFESAENEITIIGPGSSEQTLARMSKLACAEAILDAAAPLLAPATGGGGQAGETAVG